MTQATQDPLTSLAMWDTWQEQVKAALPMFAASPWYLEQESVSAQEANAIVTRLQIVFDPDGRDRDVAHGARAIPTDIGVVTRAWVDGNVEIAFLARYIGLGVLHELDVLDIGAGYGRLAVMLSTMVRSYTCVDAVPVSVDICREYTQRYAPSVRVLNVAGLREAMLTMRPSLAVNIHSWNECTRAQIAEWLTVLDALDVPWLFTVSHAADYYAWEAGHPSFKPMLLERYDLVAEEAIGLNSYPHALWRRRAA